MSLNLTGECSSLISVIEENFEHLKEVRVHGEKNKIVGVNFKNSIFKTVFRDISAWYESASDHCCF